MYAIIKTGSKQYRVEKGAVIDVELLGIDAGEKVEFKDILFVNDGEVSMVGSPNLAEYVVQGEIMDIVKGPKVFALKYKRRKNYCRKRGHRQGYSRVKITEIQQVSK